MGTPYLGEVKLMSFGFAPKGWAMCNGSLMAINQNQALFALLGTYYGGNGVQTFALPNLQGRVPVGVNSQYPVGSMGGESSHTLTANEVPMHTHVLNAAASGANTNSPTSGILAGGGASVFVTPSNLKAMNPQALSTAGGNQAHMNLQPYLVMNWCIALQGIFPTQN